MNTVGGQIVLTALLLAVAVGVVVVVERRLSRKRPAVETQGSSSDMQGIRPANSGPMMVLLTIAAGCAAAAAVVGFVGRSDAAERNASDDATVNRSTCLSTAAADWRAAIDVLLIGYTAENAETSALVRALEDAGAEGVLDGAESPEEFQSRGVELVAQSLVNDARIGDESDPLCPFVAGDPSRTPTVPDRTQVTLDGSPDGSCDGVEGPIRRGQPGYTEERDRDGDGVACE